MDASVPDVGSSGDAGMDASLPDAAPNDAGTEDARITSYGAMIRVPAGAFAMGCREDDAEWCGPGFDRCCVSYERPQHEVTVPDYLIDEVEVTVEAYDACYRDGACPVRPGRGCNHQVAGRGRHPMNCLEFEDAMAFCAWAGKRLCSEAEWEKAARGGCEHNGGEACRTATRHFPWGDALPTCELAVMDDPAVGLGCGEAGTAWVASRPAGASPYGVHDLAGNEFEWVHDCRHTNYEGAPTDGSAWLEGCNLPGMIKGGGFSSSPPLLRSATRFPRGVASESCCGVRCCADPG